MEKKVNNQKTEQKKLSYEQLEKIAENMHQQCNQLYAQLQEARQIIANFNDISMLLAVLDKSEHFTIKFTEMCADKIEKAITNLMTEGEENKEEES